MSAVQLNPQPVRVSPLIKFGRWTFLSLGIVYGIINHKRFSKKAAAIRAQEEADRPKREAKLAEEKRLAQIADYEALSDLGKL